MSSLLGKGEEPVYKRKDEEYYGRKKREEKDGYFGKPPWANNDNRFGIDVDRFYERNWKRYDKQIKNGEK